MSQTTSPGTGKPYGLARVCRVLAFPRSTIYAQQARENAKVAPLHPARRGPKPKMAEADLLAAIRADLQASPFVGYGHRKVWARLRILHDISGAAGNARAARWFDPDRGAKPDVGHRRHPYPDRGRGLGVGVLGGRSFRRLLRRYPCREDRQPLCRLAADCPGA